ncbi:MAG: T9SS type A sorting domain-containing protein, partial [Crocinitomicaceae bacterium]|nr:T9SS type A sorting domain-containing protein [Crocinitomicaceae bacterium]
YSAGSGNAMDASDQSGAVLITGNLPIKGAYIPDAMTFKTINGQGLLFTANEGDSREFGSVVDANRISSSTFNNVLDATAFPDQSILRNNKFLGRLSALKYSGDTDGDGDYDELHVMGGRSFSIWNPLTGALVYDSKDLIEQITANHPTFGAIFNASNTTGTPALKNRSDDKGPEPEGVAVATINGSTYAFVALERIGGAMMFNVDIPTSPVFVGYANNRSTTVSGPDLGAEGIIFISAADSPNNKALLILANEVSSTLSIYQINSCADLSGGSITSNDLSLCPGQTTSLSVTNVSGVSYQWLLNGAVIANATNNTYQANQVGNIAVKVTNSSLGCTDTTAVVAITSVAAPNVSAGQDQTVCGGTTVSLTASGANSYSWNNGATGSTLTILAGNTTSSINYIVTGLDNTTGCTKKDTVVIQVNGLPLINAGTDFQVCSNDTVTLSATGGTSYVWNNGIINNQAFVLSNTSTFNVTGSDANGCINSDEITVIVNQSPQLNVGNDITVCLNNAPVQLTAISNEGGLTYSWSTGASTQQISVNSSSVYSATVTNSFGCSSSDSVEVIVNELPSLNLGQDQSVCSDELPATLNAQSTSTGLVYNWSTNQNTQQIQVSLTGTYSVSVIDQNGCESTDEVAVQVLNSPNVNAGQDITVCANEFPVTLNATGNGSQVEWSTGAQTPFTTVNGAGTYTVTTTAQNGCQASDDVVVTSDPCASLVEQNDGILIYPNPTTSMVTILNKTTLPLNYCLRTIEGKIVFQGELDSSSEKTSIDLINLSNGAYLIQLFNTEFNYTTRITKQ